MLGHPLDELADESGPPAGGAGGEPARALGDGQGAVRDHLDEDRRLADLEPSTLAVMHGMSFTGDGGTALRELADAYERTDLRPYA